MKKVIGLVGILCVFSFAGVAQQDDGILRLNQFRKENKRTLIDIPDVNGFKVIKCDFHMHTVFSDGHVWPNVRIQEAWTEGVDAIALTEHMEYQPHQNDVSKDHNRSHDLVIEQAKANNLLLIKGTEVTRNTPPGHFNALFIEDANLLVSERDSEKDQLSVDKAIDQNAFIFWNHPGWKATQIPGSYEWIPFVEKMHQERKLHGIEVVNGFGFHKRALDWALDRDLTVIGNTDIHNLIAHEYDIERTGIHRTMTLVMAKDRSVEGIREALQSGRTVAWSSHYLFGKEDNIRDLFNACVKLTPSFHSKTNSKNVTTEYFELQNNSDLYFELVLKAGNGTQRIVLYPQSVQVLTAEADQSKLTYEVVSTYIRSDQHLSVDLTL